MIKPISFTRHALNVIEERSIEVSWVISAVCQPDWIVMDPKFAEIDRRFCSISEYGDRILRVVCAEDADEIRIISAFFDRKARKPE